MALRKLARRIMRGKEKDFEKRVKTFNDELATLIQKHKVGMRPMMNKYGLDVEYFDIKQAEK